MRQVGTYASGQKKGEPRYKAATKVVTRETASMNGEPFALLIKRRKYLPNIVSRFCTAELKVRRFRDYLESQGYKNWIQFLGIRADEPRRAAKLQGKVDEGHEMYLPLYLDGVTKKTVGDFWKAQDFDLQLPNNNGVTDWGNCDLCFMKRYKKRLSIIEQRPDLADWWIEQEQLASQHTNGSAARFRQRYPRLRPDEDHRLRQSIV